jgi:DNA-binding XRE family transcriptional regulator
LEIQTKAPQDPKTIGGHVNRQRLQFHLTQAALAKRLEVKTATIYHWERGLCKPSRRFSFKINQFINSNAVLEDKFLLIRISNSRTSTND